MKHKLYMMVALILIAFVAITSYTPQTAQAEMSMQEDPVSEAEEIQYTEAGEDPLRLDSDNQINTSEISSFDAVGINFVPHDSALIYYNAGEGCLASQYDGTIAKTFTIPVNVPNEAVGFNFHFTYRNNVDSPSNGPIEVSLWRRLYRGLDTEEVKKYTLNNTGIGAQHQRFSIEDVTFERSVWLYWLEFKLPNGAATREFCGVCLTYFNPPLFPVALPMINK